MLLPCAEVAPSAVGPCLEGAVVAVDFGGTVGPGAIDDEVVPWLAATAGLCDPPLVGWLELFVSRWPALEGAPVDEDGARTWM